MDSRWNFQLFHGQQPRLAGPHAGLQEVTDRVANLRKPRGFRTKQSYPVSECRETSGLMFFGHAGNPRFGGTVASHRLDERYRESGYRAARDMTNEQLVCMIHFPIKLRASDNS